MQSYVPILVFVLIAGGFVAVLLQVAKLLRHKESGRTSTDPYECGNEPETCFEKHATCFPVLPTVAFGAPWRFRGGPSLGP